MFGCRHTGHDIHIPYFLPLIIGSLNSSFESNSRIRTEDFNRANFSFGLVDQMPNIFFFGNVASDGDTIDVAYGTAVVVTDANQSTAEDQYVTAESGAVTIAGTPADDDMCYFRFFRDVSDAADTATEDMRLIGIKFFYTTDAGNDA